MPPMDTDDKYSKSNSESLFGIFVAKRLWTKYKRLLLIFCIVVTVVNIWPRKPNEHSVHDNYQSDSTLKVDKFHPKPAENLETIHDSRESTELDRNAQSETHMPQSNGYEDRDKMEYVKKMMAFSWDNYKKYAWGKDEIKPVSKVGREWYGNYGLASTIIDSLDTLYIMGFTEEFKNSTEYIVSEFDFKKPVSVSVFETTIRCVGGLLSAYELGGDTRLIDKAKELADLLLPSFNSGSGLPYGRINLETGATSNHKWARGSVLAEIGSMQLEFQYLSKLTGDEKYASVSFKALEYVLNAEKPIKGLYPTFIDTNTGKWKNPGIYTVGPLADSFYEYLLKLWLQSGKADTKYRNYWVEAAKSIQEHLVRKTPEGFDYIGSGHVPRVSHDMDHLTCFAGGMFALAGKTIEDENADQWFSLGANLTETCYKMYEKQPHGLSPEKTRITNWMAVIKYYILRPEAVESLFYMWRFTHDEKYRQWGWEIAKSIEQYCRVEGGYSGIHDITKPQIRHNDNQESFYLAETLKYLYLLFADDDLIPLNKYVFNTEAHPFPIVDFHEDPSKGGQLSSSQ